ncbi:hypothetical protein CC86DRAFT_423885 [Ophiobolus disseminans]|uniref:Uncharacterized protein n=1 Tax=Ophiobolus disseminans TaxID=1469910 RepID=A0A6A6ZPF2_9PLEO|nr:hypothetical protein CC86DRAFT_423885 [Ophiobolus disseminans]
MHSIYVAYILASDRCEWNCSREKLRCYGSEGPSEARRNYQQGRPYSFVDGVTARSPGSIEEGKRSSMACREHTSSQALKKAQDIESVDHSEGLKLFILLLLYSDDAGRGANFEKSGILDNDLLGLPSENMVDVVERLLKG